MDKPTDVVVQEVRRRKDAVIDRQIDEIRRLRRALTHIKDILDDVLADMEPF